MDNDKLRPNELKILIFMLNQLEKRIHLFRLSWYGDTKNYFPYGNLVCKEKLDMENNEFESTYNISTIDYRLIVDSVEIESCIRHILQGTAVTKTHQALKEVVMELESESTSFKRHRKMIEAKKEQINQLKEALAVEQEEAHQITSESFKVMKLDETGVAEKKIDFPCDTDFLNMLMNYKVESRKSFFDHQEAGLEESIECLERETRTQKHADAQTISFWLLKYDDHSEKLDLMLKQTFDNWAFRKRQLEILKKYRKLNLEKIQKLHKLISDRDDYIEKEMAQKREELRIREQELRIQNAATIIQAHWRGTMVRKKLGPYKVKKTKKGKNKKGKKGKKK